MKKVERCVKLALLYREKPQAAFTSDELAQRFDTPRYTIVRDLHDLSRTGILPLVWSRGKWMLLQRLELLI